MRRAAEDVMERAPESNARPPRQPWWMVLVLALALAAVSGAALKLAHDRARTASLAFAWQAREANDAGDHGTALLWALMGLPQPGELWGPVSDEARAELLRAYANHRRPRIPEGHSDWVTSVSFSPDGKTVLTASFDKTAKLWHAATGKLLRTLSGHGDLILHAAFNPSGTRVITASQDRTARIWNAQTGEMLKVLKGHDASVVYATFDPAGARVVTTAYSNTARLWDARSGALLHALEAIDDDSGRPDEAAKAVYHAAFSPDGKRVVTAYLTGKVRIWNAETGELEHPLPGHEFHAEKALFGPSGKRVATVGWDGAARLWEADTGRELCALEGHGGIVREAVFNPQGDIFVTVADDAMVRIWDPVSCKPVRTLTANPPPTGDIFYVSGPQAHFNPAGTRLLAITGDRTARLWDVKTGMLLETFPHHRGRITSAAFSPGGEHVATATWNGAVHVWNMKPPNLTRTLMRFDGLEIEYLVFDPSGKRLGTAERDGTVRLWNSATGELLHILTGHEDAVLHLAFDGTGARLITVSADRTARIWNAETGELLQVLAGESDALIRAFLDAGGTRALTISRDSSASVWDAGTGTRLHSFKLPRANIPDCVLDCMAECIPDCIPDAAFTPHGPRVFAQDSPDSNGTLWNAETGEAVRVFETSDGSSVTGAFSRSGTHLVTSAGSASGPNVPHIWEAGTGALVMTLPPDSQFESRPWLYWSEKRLIVDQSLEIDVWDLTNARLLRTLKGTSGVKLEAAFTGDDTVVTGADFREVRLWDLRTGLPLMDFPAHDGIRRMAVDKAGTRVATVSIYNLLQLWEISPVFRAGPMEQVRMACMLAARTGAAEFSGADRQDPLLRGRPADPCNRPGLLSARYYRKIADGWFGGKR